MTEALRAVITSLTCERNELESKLRNLRGKFAKLQKENETIRGRPFAVHLADYDPSDPGCSD